MSVGHVQHKLSVYNPPRVKPPGIPKKSLSLGGKWLKANVFHWGGRSFRCDPRQLGFTFSNGNEAHMEVTELGGPEFFYKSRGIKNNGSGVVIGRFNGKPGEPTGPIEWKPLSFFQVPGKAKGILARLSSGVGRERGLGNIISCRAEEGSRDVTVTHVSEGTDRKLIVLNEEGWEKKHPKRKQLIEQLDRILVNDIERTELSEDGKILTLYSKILDSNENNYRYDLDVSCLKLDPSKIYHNPEDKKFSIKIIVPCERTDFEALERTELDTIYTHEIQHTKEATVKGYRDDDGIFHITIEPKEEGAKPIEIKGKSRRKIFNTLEFASQSFRVKRAISKTITNLYDVDNFKRSRVDKLRERYVLQFHSCRETKFKNVLDQPLEQGESVVVTEVKSAMRVVHLNDLNGREKGFEEVVPLNFKLPPNTELVRLDPRPHAQNKTRFVNPVASAIAPQHLIDPYMIGTEIMAAIWPKVDQLGFFGVMMTSAMAFPYGNQFADPAKNPWFIRHFGSVSHSIFSAKGDAGLKYHFLTGNPIHTKESMGAAMVTGPNTDAVNPAREGHLFFVRMPGRAPHKVKTAIPGFYILVIEDAQVSYMDMTMYGLKTETTVLPFSAGGGLENYQLAWTVQRSQRWNAGICLFLMDAAGEMWIDFIRGNSVYRFAYNAVNGLAKPKTTSIITSARKDALSTLQPTSTAKRVRETKAFAPQRPAPKKFKFNEAREWLNVGTWYLVSAAKQILYSSVPIMILLSILPIPVAGSMFLWACLASTLFAWPFWAGQMMKVGVNPKGILSMLPIHLFWNDMPMRTMTTSAFDIERMGVGRFRISDKSLGNRLPTKDKRMAYWIASVLPTFAGAALLGSALYISMAASFLPILISAAPFLAGFALSKVFSRIAKRLLPNPGPRSFVKSTVRWLASVAPIGAGIYFSALFFGAATIIAIPLITAIMAGGWSLYMGLNIRHCFKKYFKEQRNAPYHSEPNPIPGTIPKNQADTPRNMRREAIGKELPRFAEDEFTSHNDPNISPKVLWDDIQTAVPNILNKPGGNPLANLNTLIEGKNDLYKELTSFRPGLLMSIWNDLRHWYSSPTHAVWRRIRIGILAFRTRADRGKETKDLESEQYERIKELNRLLLEEVFPEHTPRKFV